MEVIYHTKTRDRTVRLVMDDIGLAQVEASLRSLQHAKKKAAEERPGVVPILYMSLLPVGKCCLCKDGDPPKGSIHECVNV